MNKEVQHSFCFEAGHLCCSGTAGSCSFPHGHSYVLIVKRRGQDLQADNDAAVAVIQNMLSASFQHKWLNATLHSSSPDLQYISLWIADFLKSKVPGLFEIVLYDSADHFVKQKI